MIVKFSNIFHSVELSLDPATVNAFDNSVSLEDLLEPRHIDILRRAFPRTPFKNIIAYSPGNTGDRYSRRVLWCFRPSAGRNSKNARQCTAS